MNTLKVWGGLIALIALALYIGYKEGYIGNGSTTATPATGTTTA